MFKEMLYTPGLAHLSYIVGDGGQAAVIDPRRDIDVYLEIAGREGAQVTHVFETHRNEDYAIGSLDIARRTGAEIYHGSQLDFKYGKPAKEGDEFTFGNVKLSVLHTPGHTMESISLVYYDLEFSTDPLGVFAGDALFIGDVGRTDFFPDRAEEVSGMLYDSIFGKLLPLGDHVLLWPAHGAGSVCGSGMADRNFSTLGYERKHNPTLQKIDRDDFIRHKVNEEHFQPPYFRQMEKYNLEGTPALDQLPWPKPLPPDQFSIAVDDGMIVVDVRSPEAFAGAHVPGSFCLPLNMLPAFAGMFLDYEKPIGLVVENYNQIDEAVRSLIRIGYDKVEAFLSGGLHAWETSGRRYEKVESVHIADLERKLEQDDNFTLLDVRSKEEFESAHLRKAVQLYVGELPQKFEQVPKDKPVITFCESGRRAMVAASYLRRRGVDSVADCLGSMAACKSIGCKALA
ncbi:MAG: MBL fold metallo-hydrolase [Planctomycetota bacterium]